MKILKKLWFLLFAFTLSCSVKKNSSTNLYNKVTLYKQVSTGVDSSFSFDKKDFWETNFKEYTFIYQIFADNEYQNIIDKVKKKNFKGNIDPQYFNSVVYAFVAERKNRKNNDTVYYDGSKRWWIKEKESFKLYEDEDEETKLAKELRLYYPIFRSCGYND